MKSSASHNSEINNLSQSANLDLSWEDIKVQLLENPAGEGTCHYQHQHTLFISLSSRPIHYLHRQDCKTHTGLYQRGEILLTPADTPLFARWSGEEHCLKIQLSTQLLQRVAQETLEQDPDRLELLPEFQLRNPQLEAVGLMLLTELQQKSPQNRLYLDSLSNVLAVNLLRQHTTTKPQLPRYEGGLSPRQLSQVLDYVDAHLEHNIKLADLARLLNMSPFHFSRLFKQSVRITPHQYLSQQRVELAKQLLQQTDQFITDIALECGFSSHSHLGKQFRQLTGMTPKAYRTAYGKKYSRSN